MATYISSKRFALCLSPHDLANLLGITTLEVCDIEKGTKQTTPELQQKFARILTADPHLLFDEDGFANFMD